jgi:hypothetical protein
MKFNPNGFVAWVVFGAEGERKPMGICTLGSSFLLQLAHLVLKTTFCLLGRVTSFAVFAPFFGDKPVFNWLIPAPWASKPTPMFIQILPKEVAKKREEVAMSLMMTFAFGGFLLALLWGATMVVGLAVINNGYQLGQLSTDPVKNSGVHMVYLTIHGITAVVGLFLAFYLPSKAVRSEPAKLLFGWLKAKKDKVCPVVTFEA